MTRIPDKTSSIKIVFKNTSPAVSTEPIPASPEGFTIWPNVLVRGALKDLSLLASRCVILIVDKQLGWINFDPTLCHGVRMQIKDFCHWTGACERSVRYALKEARNLGVITVTESSGGRGRKALYSLEWRYLNASLKLLKRNPAPSCRVSPAKPCTGVQGFDSPPYKEKKTDGDKQRSDEPAAHNTPHTQNATLRATCRSDQRGTLRDEAAESASETAASTQNADECTPEPGLDEVSEAKRRFSRAEWHLIIEAVTNFQVVAKDTSNERPIKISDVLIARILLAGNGATATQISTHLLSRLEYVAHNPRSWPMREQWLIQVTKNEFENTRKNVTVPMSVSNPVSAPASIVANGIEEAGQAAWKAQMHAFAQEFQRKISSRQRR